jgi:hypothetical protein
VSRCLSIRLMLRSPRQHYGTPRKPPASSNCKSASSVPLRHPNSTRSLRPLRRTGLTRSSSRVMHFLGAARCSWSIWRHVIGYRRDTRIVITWQSGGLSATEQISRICSVKSQSIPVTFSRAPDRRLAGRAIHQVRVRDQPANGQDARHRRAPSAACHCRRGDRVGCSQTGVGDARQEYANSQRLGICRPARFVHCFAPHTSHHPRLSRPRGWNGATVSCVRFTPVSGRAPRASEGLKWPISCHRGPYQRPGS